MVHRHRSLNRWRCDAAGRHDDRSRFPLQTLLATGLWVCSVLGGASVGSPSSSQTDRAGLPRRPQLGKNLSAPIVLQLQLSFRLAVGRLHRVPSCQALFDAFDAHGVTLLSRTEYEGSDDRLEADPPHPRYRVAKAMTVVGSRSTVLRRSFAAVSRREAAVTLIHEALHFAGMSEAPADPEGLTPGEIDRLVAEACNL